MSPEHICAGTHCVECEACQALRETPITEEERNGEGIDIDREFYMDLGQGDA